MQIFGHDDKHLDPRWNAYMWIRFDLADLDPYM